MHDIDSHVQEMIALIKEAAKTIVMPRFGLVQKELKHSVSGLEEAVTEADLLSSEFILSRLSNKLPGSYSEEHISAKRFDFDLLWQIDPIDGTQEFISGDQSGFVMQAALLAKNPEGKFHPLASVVFMPALDELVYATKGAVHYFRQGQAAPVAKSNRREIRGITRKINPNIALMDYYQELGEKSKLPSSVFYGGGSGASLFSLLRGEVNLILSNSNNSKEWDISMYEPILSGLGGFVSDLNGAVFSYNKADLVNHNGYAASYSFQAKQVLPGNFGIEVDGFLCTYDVSVTSI